MGPVRRKVRFRSGDADSGQPQGSSPPANAGRRSGVTRYWGPSKFKIPPPPENASADTSAAGDLAALNSGISPLLLKTTRASPSVSLPKNASALVPRDPNPACVRPQFKIPPPPNSNPADTLSIADSQSPAHARQASPPSRTQQHPAVASDRPRHHFRIPSPPSPIITGLEGTNASTSSGATDQGVMRGEPAGNMEMVSSPPRVWMAYIDTLRSRRHHKHR